MAGPVRCCYRLDLQTSDVSGDRLAGSVSVALIGELGSAGPFELSAGSGGTADDGPRGSGWSAGGVFERGALDSFLLEGIPDLGAIQEASASIPHDLNFEQTMSTGWSGSCSSC